jgi:hypothetical protein
MMVEYDLSKHPGRWRPGPIQVVDEAKKEVVYRAPDAEVVPELMEELVSSLNQAGDSTASMVRAAMGHLNFVMIHPFLRVMEEWHAAFSLSSWRGLAPWFQSSQTLRSISAGTRASTTIFYSASELAVGTRAGMAALGSGFA